MDNLGVRLADCLQADLCGRFSEELECLQAVCKLNGILKLG